MQAVRGKMPGLTLCTLRSVALTTVLRMVLAVLEAS